MYILQFIFSISLNIDINESFIVKIVSYLFIELCHDLIFM